MPLVLVTHAGSGSADEGRVQACVAVLRSAGVPVRVLRAEQGAAIPALAGRAAALAAREQGAVVAVGGDGTINAVAAAALGAGCSMGVLPQGTFNYFARTHGLPDDPEAAARVWCAGHTALVQVAAVNDRPFVVNASLGIYPDILLAREADSAAYGRSRWVALWSAARTALRSRRVLRLKLQQAGHTEHVHASLLFIGNNRLQIENLGLPIAAAVGDDRLGAIRVAPLDWAATLRLLMRGAIGRLAPADEVSCSLFDELTITPARRLARRRLQVACDGEVAWMEAPLHIRVLPTRLRLLCPRPG
jgi:diacylglycerol kinase family enzyme